MFRHSLLFIVIALLTGSCATPLPESNPSSRGLATESTPKNYPEDSFENGFVILDVLEKTPYNKKQGKDEKNIFPLMREQDLNKVKQLGLKPFEPNFNFSDPAKPLDATEPWLQQGLDIRVKADALKFAKILQAYAYEGWFDENKLTEKDYDNQFRVNTRRTWCHTPWLNLTEKGREAIHGLTKEFPISTTSIYKVPEAVEKNETAVSWGVGFFNRKVCEQYDKFFDPPHAANAEAGISEMIRSRTPAFTAKDGSVGVKLLFNAMPDWKNQMAGAWDGAYSWNAHVSHARQNDRKKDGDESLRAIMNIPHIQMDISFKDSRVTGTDPQVKNWVMMTYYFDPTYNNDFLKDAKIAEPLKHMRPVGLQYGLEAGESIIFDGSKNNHRPEGDELPYQQTRLNGPLDNQKSSCLGCHAISGINFGLDGQNGPRFAPGTGFLTFANYQEFLAYSNQGSFEFNMQLDKAMRNFSKSKKHKVFPENLK